ncbi:MAG: family 43 glycosylhydrolase [Eubacteriales bacterium]|nr:family 43 glycosylhydrolase [Eubacteriales bacterium]
MLYKNPIIPGYNPDPSICRVGDDFYLVNSTFEFFPGVPIYHSKNLINWELTGYCLNRRSQLELEGCRNSGGIYAPTIRFHNGIFYMITTNVTDKGNFIVHTDNIKGDWSEPVWIDQGGIDPSLFWDDDDRCYYCSTGILDGIRGIVAFEINPMTGEILSDKKLISEGCGGQCAEGPHIYKKDGCYYLFIAEGGTEYAHRETVQRSANIFGPYTPCPHNPIISHKEYKKSEIQATGHADLVDDANGNWWLVFLGIRRFSHALLHNLGRETFLAPVSWSDDGWPVAGYNGNGTVELVMDAPLPAADHDITKKNQYIVKEGDAITNPSLYTKGGHIFKDTVPTNSYGIKTAAEISSSIIGKTALLADHSIHISLSEDKLDRRLQYTRNPESGNYIHNPAAGSLTLKGTDISLNEPGKSPTILSFKQPEFTTTLTAVMNPAKTSARRSGIAAYYNNDYHYEIYIGNDSDGKYIGFYKHIHDMGAELSRIPLNIESDNPAYVIFKIDTDREGYTFSYAIADTCSASAKTAFRQIGFGLNAGLSTEGTRTMTFTGTLFSLFAEAGDGVFENTIDVVINPDVDYNL